MADGHCRAAAELRTIAVVVLQHDSRHREKLSALLTGVPHRKLTRVAPTRCSSARLLVLQMIWLLVSSGSTCTARADICCGVLLRFRVHAT